MTAMKINEAGLNDPARAKLLGVVDEFRALGISKEISLPQVSLPNAVLEYSFSR
jgi:hypothetical protein